jgi:hypothetical protein
MKLSELKPPKIMVKGTSVPAMLDSLQLFDRLVKHGWLRPAVASDKETGCDLFLVAEVEGAAQRLRREKLPA